MEASSAKIQGFSLIEMLLSIAIISLIAGMSLPVLNSYQTRNDLELTAQSIASALRRAQLYSRGQKNDTQWGVEVQSTAVTLFRGNNFASRNTDYDEAVAIPASTTISGLTEVLFSKLSGTPIPTGTITLTTNTNETRTITINAEGMVNY